MNKIITMTSLVALMLCSSGCIYANFRVPMSTEFNDIDKVEKSGESSSHSVAWLVAWGDAGLQAAAEEGDLQTLEYVDYEFMNVFFGIYMRRKTIVYGN